MQLMPPPEGRGVHPDQTGDEHDQEDLADQRLEHCIGAGETRGRRQIAVPHGRHGDVAEVREVTGAMVPRLGEERVPRDELDSVVGIGEHQPDQHVDAQRPKNGLRRDARVVQESPADGDGTGQDEERRQDHDDAVLPVASTGGNPDRTRHDHRHGDPDHDHQPVRHLGGAEGQENGEPEPDGGDDEGGAPAPAHGEEDVVDEEEQEHDPVGVRSQHDVPQGLPPGAPTLLVRGKRPLGGRRRGRARHGSIMANRRRSQGDVPKCAPREAALS